MPQYTLKVLAEDSGKRIDIYITDFFKAKKLGLSRVFIQKLILEGGVILKDSDLKLSAHYKVKAGEEFIVSFEEKKPGAPQAEDISLEIVYEDEDLAVINKPAGLVVHPAPGNPGHTLVNALLHYFKQLSDISPQRPGIVHRLDKDTSGLLVIARNNFSHLNLAKQFAQHSIKRKYIALVKGRMEFDENIIEVPIARHPYKRKSMSAGFGKEPKYARTHYRTLKRGDDFSLVELEPFTGRTHQLRVHLAFLGHPILGDVKYGRNNKFVRLALHAKYLGFVHPRTGKFMEFSNAMPKEFTKYT